MNDGRSIKVIGVSGVARAGKDTFVSILINRLKERGKSSAKIALADPLKEYCDSFCRANLGVTAFTQIPAEKLLIRPMLVWFGDAKRKQTNGRFWVDLASKSIDKLDGNVDYAIISDVRYDHYERDEVDWLKLEQKGVLIHVSRYTSVGDVKEYVPPANDHELLNDPKVKNKSDYRVEWPTIPNVDLDNLDTHPSMIKYVDNFLDSQKIN